MKFIDKKSEAFLFSYLNKTAPTGWEVEGQKAWLEYIKPFVDEWDRDTYGTAYGIINPGKDFKVVIEAHADEISWMVSHISDDGFIRVIRNGGSDHVITPAKRVFIHGSMGPVKAVFGWPAIHLRKGKNAKLAPSMDNIYLDIGAKDREAVLNKGIHVGSIATFEDGFEALNADYYIGRALDNRLGGFAIAQVARAFYENKDELPFSLYIVNAVQEEVGLRGAQMIAERIQPQAAIIIDVTHDTTTPMLDVKKNGEVKCGDGPSITYAPAVHNVLRDLIIEVAEAKNISIQREASSRGTGTDTDAFAYSNAGVPSALLSIPLRYMHTTVEMAHKSDIENLIGLMYESVKAIEDQHEFHYF
ncbi:MAG: M20/M25/M40 family metallo-hydrolase [Bacteroidetes bacterium]|jgi:putative aminopeptidase FrvX|nr:M20/M25/M40 family metallo-hydrolase [Bacteroidota bacterium]